MTPVERPERGYQGTNFKTNQMKKLISICAVSLVVMHANQDLSPMYWAGLVVFMFSVILIANRLDKEGENNNEILGNKKH